MSIQVQNISKLYGLQEALSDVSFSIPAGQIAAFIGPNGAGKSTMMKIITGFIPATRGSVEVCGSNVEADPVGIRRKIGYLPEHNPLYPEMYVLEYLEYVSGHYNPPESVNGRTNAQRWRRERIETVVEMTGLLPEKHKKIQSLSKGYRQRVGLAQAILHDPEVLILDEPTSGLDPNQIVEIRNLISRLGKEKTVLLSTHLMQEVEAICDRVLIIRKGQLVADGRPGEISAAGKEQNLTIEVEFDREIDPTLLETLDNVSRVKACKTNHYLVETTTDADLRPVLFRLAVEKGFTILSMQLKEKKLEEVFRDLTL
jgi:ABC-2 type transport system ATP-binding protein